MDSKDKKIIYDILFDKNLLVEEKYQQIIEKFPSYLQNVDEKKVIYEKIE
jgi:hypothetical protein